MIHDFELDGYPAPVETRPTRRRWWMSTWGLMKVIFAVGCGLWLLIVLFDAVSYPIPRRAICVNNLKQIALALHNYHEQYGSFPPAFVADAGGRPIHSWRVLILPYMEQESLYRQYDFREPWDGPNNIKLLEETPQFFACRYLTDRPGLTSYLAITGPGTIFPGAIPVKLDQVSDGTAKTLMIVEALKPEIPWTAPWDLDIEALAFGINAPKRPGIGSRHPGGANVAMASGEVRFVSEKTSPDALRALATTSGGEKIDPDEVFHPR